MHNLRRATIQRSPCGETSVVVTRSAFRRQVVHFAISLLLTCAFVGGVSYQIGWIPGLIITAVILVAAPVFFLLYARSPRSMREGHSILTLRDGMVINRWNEKVPLDELRSISVVRLKFTRGRSRWEEFILLNDETKPVLAVDHRQEPGEPQSNDLPELACSLTGLKYQVIRSVDGKKVEHLDLNRFRRLL